jgi:hypothetical protein
MFQSVSEIKSILHFSTKSRNMLVGYHRDDDDDDDDDDNNNNLHALLWFSSSKTYSS